MKRLSVVSLCGCALIAGFLGAKTLVALDDKKAAAERARQDFELMRLFADAYEQIDANYVREVDRRKLVDAAIRGMANHLDPHSTFIPRKISPSLNSDSSRSLLALAFMCSS